MCLLFSASCGGNVNQFRFGLACINGDIRLVTQLTERPNVNIDAINGEIGPCLGSASYGGHKEIAELMLAKGADVEIRDKQGLTPLISATVSGKAEIVKLLLENGADANAVVIKENGERTEITAIKIARDRQYKDIQVLLERASEK